MATRGQITEKAVLVHEDEYRKTFPIESYVDETYWADLPIGQRIRWMLKQQTSEEKAELAAVWKIFKQDPLEPFVIYWKRYVISGMGLFTEGYVLFSITNIHTLFQQSYQPCWKTFTECSEVWTQTTDYFQVVGIILGQLLVGFLGDWLGRRWGMIQDAVIMLLGAIMLSVATGTTINGWVIMYAISQLVYGVGVGGEYPMTGTSAAEKETPGSRADKLHRGRNVVLAFTMQGWGQLANHGVLMVGLLAFNSKGSGPCSHEPTVRSRVYGSMHNMCCLLYRGGGWGQLANLGVLMVGLLAFNSKGSGPYSHGAAGATYRFSFAFIAVFIAWLAYFRIWRLKGADTHLNASKAKNKASGYDSGSFGMLLKHFWHRLLGTCLCWFCNDFMFYGNATFRTVFIGILVGPNASVMTNWLWNLLNVGVSLFGYHFAAFSIDWKWYGRKRMQAIGFLADFILFLLPAALWGTLTGSVTGTKVFQFIYFFSSFWNQFGPNCTTFLVAAEVYPTSVRSTAHGMSAAVGKCGALVPTVLFNYIGNTTKFWVVCWAGLLGFFMTVMFIPDATGLDLLEQERRWDYMQQGRGKEYHGIAVHPRHLSLFEKGVLGIHHQYNPELDAEAKKAEASQKVSQRLQDEDVVKIADDQ
ncbi:TPA: hypothetical protein ACH3X2_011377 [Trebouxia sp. C0005]